MDRRQQPIFASVPNRVLVQLLGQILELLLPSSISQNVSILGPSRWSCCNECSRCATAIGCFLFSAAFIAGLSATCTTPTKSRQTRPSFPTWAISLSELAGHQGLWFHQPDARLRNDHTAECSIFHDAPLGGLRILVAAASCSSWMACSTDVATLWLFCKEYTSYYRKLATKTVYIQQEELHEH